MKANKDRRGFYSLLLVKLLWSFSQSVGKITFENLCGLELPPARGPGVGQSNL